MLVRIKVSPDVRLCLDLLSFQLLNLSHKVHQLKPVLLFQKREDPPEVSHLVLKLIL